MIDPVVFIDAYRYYDRKCVEWVHIALRVGVINVNTYGYPMEIDGLFFII